MKSNEIRKKTKTNTEKTQRADWAFFCHQFFIFLSYMELTQWILKAIWNLLVLAFGYRRECSFLHPLYICMKEAGNIFSSYNI